MRIRFRIAMILVGITVVVGASLLFSEQQGNKLDPARLSLYLGGLMAGEIGPVLRAKNDLESEQADAIPFLLGELTSPERMPDIKSGDVTVGFDQLKPHGYSIPYDLPDKLVRIGWVLESLTFCAFGFDIAAPVRDPELRELTFGTRRDSDNLLRAELGRSVPLRRIAIAEAKRRALRWWAGSRKPWSRIDAWVEAATSQDSRRRGLALGWLLDGRSRCDGLTRASFDARVLPEVRRLANEGDQLAAMIMESPYYHLRLKLPGTE